VKATALPHNLFGTIDEAPPSRVGVTYNPVFQGTQLGAPVGELSLCTAVAIELFSVDP
jgi:hypothetical protein